MFARADACLPFHILFKLQSPMFVLRIIIGMCTLKYSRIITRETIQHRKQGPREHKVSLNDAAAAEIVDIPSGKLALAVAFRLLWRK